MPNLDNLFVKKLPTQSFKILSLENPIAQRIRKIIKRVMIEIREEETFIRE